MATNEVEQQEEPAVLEQSVEPPSGEPEEAAAVETLEGEPPGDDVESLRQQLEEEQRKAAEYYDQWLRSVAELRNYKKRVDQEREYLAREANALLVGHLLPALDDFERAMAVLPDEKLAHFSWIEGIVLIYRRIYAVLEQHGLRTIEAAGQPFDPYVHEAILFEEVPADQDQIVLAELQRGYKLHDRLLRPALVKVGKGPALTATEEVEQSETETEAPPPSTAEEAGHPAETEQGS